MIPEKIEELSRHVAPADSHRGVSILSQLLPLVVRSSFLAGTSGVQCSVGHVRLVQTA